MLRRVKYGEDCAAFCPGVALFMLLRGARAVYNTSREGSMGFRCESRKTAAASICGASLFGVEKTGRCAVIVLRGVLHGFNGRPQNCFGSTLSAINDQPADAIALVLLS